MTLRIHAPNPMRVGETGNVLVTSDNPGVVSLTYGAGLTGPATVEITGTRVWRNGLKHGQYLAREGASTAARVDCAWFLEIDTNDLAFRNGGVNNDYTNIAVVQNFADGVRFTNWAILASAAKTLSGSMWFNWSFVASASSGVADLLRTFSAAKQLTTHGIQRAIIQFVDSTGDLELYQTTGTVRDTRITISPKYTGTMGGTEYLVIRVPCKFAKLDSLPSQAQREAFMAAGTLPAGLAASYQGGHEIVESAPVFWDTSGNNLDLSAVNVQYWPAAAASGDYTDTVPVVPYALVPVTAVATTGTTIDATRPRQGVPSRASYSERTEVADQCVVTVNDPVGAVGPAITARVKL